MFTNVGLTVEMYFEYILKREWVLGKISFPSKSYWHRKKPNFWSNISLVSKLVT